MAQESQKYAFPPQEQPQQPGIEHKMRPLPEALDPNYKPSDKLQGKVALITGGDSGIGRSVSYYFAMEGATVAFTYVEGVEDKDKDDTLEMIKKLKTCSAKDPLAIAADIGFEENCKRVVDKVVCEYGRIDILVNNAAVQYFSNTVQEITTATIEDSFRTNIFSHFFLTSYALNHMKRGSCIINTASDVAYTGTSYLLTYSSTKGAIVTFTRSLSQLLVEKGIRVNAVAPGPVWTPLEVALGALPPGKVPVFGLDVPMRRAAQPFEMAPSYVFLASNELSSYFTGQVLHPNGGVIINC